MCNLSLKVQACFVYKSLLNRLDLPSDAPFINVNGYHFNLVFFVVVRDFFLFNPLILNQLLIVF